MKYKKKIKQLKSWARLVFDFRVFSKRSKTSCQLYYKLVEVGKKNLKEETYVLSKLQPAGDSSANAGGACCPPAKTDYFSEHENF